MLDAKRVSTMVARLRKLGVFHQVPLSKLVLVHEKGGKETVTADVGWTSTAWGEGVPVMLVRYAASSSESAVMVLLLHELVHLALPESEDHGPAFRLLFVLAAQEAWGLDLWGEWVGDKEEGYEWTQAAISHALAVRGVEFVLRGWFHRLVNRAKSWMAYWRKG